MCIRQRHLTNYGYQNLTHWIKSSRNHIYIGRNIEYYLNTYNLPLRPCGRVQKTIYLSKGFQNPFVISSTVSRNESLRRYREYIKQKQEYLIELREDMVLGCFCENYEQCHADILIDLFEKKKTLNYD
jgi:hypothetical protein